MSAPRTSRQRPGVWVYLAAALAVTIVATKTGALGELGRGDGDERRAPEIEASETTRRALGGLAPGLEVGGFVVKSVSEPSNGAIIVRVEPDAVFEIRLLSERVAAPASAGPYGVYYRSPRSQKGPTGEELGRGAAALAEVIARAPADAAVPGLSPPESASRTPL